MSKNLESLVKDIIKFNKARGWNPVLSDISKSIVIEASELLEHFQWDESSKNNKKIQPKDLEEIGEEVADIFWYLATFSETAGINLLTVIEDKTKKNEEKYPAAKFKGKHNDKFYKKQKGKYRLRKKKK